MKDNTVSLNDFVGFLSKTGKQRQNFVKQVKNRPEYEKPFDFYAPFRDTVISLHKKNKGKEGLDSLINELSDEKKKNNYPTLINGYKQFWGRKEMKWFNPPKRDWNIGEVTIRINPELGLEFKNNFYIIKLYCKDEQLRKDQVDQILSIMEMQLRGKIKEPEMQLAFLNVRKNRLYIYDKKKAEDIRKAIEIEAKAFNEYWKSL